MAYADYKFYRETYRGTLSESFHLSEIIEGAKKIAKAVKAQKRG